MVLLCLSTDFKFQFLQWNAVTVLIKEPISLLGKPYLNIFRMHEVVIKTAEPVSTREATEILVKIIYSTHAREDL